MKDYETFSRRDAVFLVLLAGLVALFFWRILTPNPADRAQFPPGDFTDQFYAFRLYEARALAAGRLPLWSENFNSGHPFLADIQAAVFYPIALGNMLLNRARFGPDFSLFALELEALLHFYLAGAFTYLFARRTIRSRVGALTAALVFTFGGYLTSYPALQLAILETAVWLPLVLYFLASPVLSREGAAARRRAVETGRRPVPMMGNVRVGALEVRPLIAAGIVLGIAALAGHPQTWSFVAATSAAYFMFRRWESGALVPTAQSVARTAGALGLLFAIAFGLAAVQWLPSLEYQQLSTRENLSFADAAKGFPTLDILQFIFPGFASAFASPLYVGILPLWLALYGLRRTRERAFWGLWALGALILSFGFYVFAYVVFYLFVPGAALFRQQERLAFVVSFALAMLAGYGLSDLLHKYRRVGDTSLDVRRARKLYLLLPAGAVVSFVLLITFFAAGAQNPSGRLAFLGDRAGLMLILFGLASLLVGLYLGRILGPRGFALLAVGLLLFDLWSVNEPANKGRVEERFAAIPFREGLNDPSVFRIAADPQLLPGHFGIPTRLEEIGGISPLRLARYDALLKLPPEVYRPLLNVKYLITRGTAADGVIVANAGDMHLVQLNRVLPRVWLVGRAIVEADDERAARLLENDMDPTQLAVLAGTPPFALDPRAATGTVRILMREPERMALDVKVPADGLLIVSENFYPGWQATIDGAPVEILRANLTLRAIPVRAGQHRVELVYDPLTLKIGALLTIATLGACAILLCVEGYKLQVARSA